MARTRKSGSGCQRIKGWHGSGMNRAQAVGNLDILAV